jgi:hypothetical protein
VTQIASKLGELRTDTDANTQAIGGLNEKLGSSIWQAILERSICRWHCLCPAQASWGGYSVRRIKRDKPNSGRAAVTGLHQSEAESTSALVSPARPEAQILRLVPKIPAFSPWEAYFSAMREYQAQWFRIWSSWMPR